MSKSQSEFKFRLLEKNKDSVPDVWESDTYWQFANHEAREIYRKNPVIEWHISERAKLFFSQGCKPDQFKSKDPNRGQGFVVVIEFVRTDSGKLGGLIELVPTCNLGDNLPGTTAEGKEFISNGINMLVRTKQPLGGHTGGAHKDAIDKLDEADAKTSVPKHVYQNSMTAGCGIFVGLFALIGEYRVSSGILNIPTFLLNPLFKMLHCDIEHEEVDGSAFWFKRKLPEEISDSLLAFLLKELPIKKHQEQDQERKVTSDSRQDILEKEQTNVIKLWKSMPADKKEMGLQIRLIDFLKRKMESGKYSVTDLMRDSQKQGFLLDLNFKDKSNRMPLSYAFENKNTTPETVETLIRAGADLFILDDSKKMPINYDINGLGFLVICQMIYKEPQNKKWQEFLNTYIQAKLETIDIGQQAPRTLESLILKMINSYPTLLSTPCASLYLNFQDDFGRTTLSYILENKSITASEIETFIVGGANLFIQDKHGKIPVDYDINDLGLAAICKLLRRQPWVEKWQDLLNEYMDVRMKTIDMGQRNPQTGESLILTMLTAYPELLSTKYASQFANVKDQFNRTALSYALENKNTTESTVEAFIRKGADLFKLDESKKMPVNYDINGLGFLVICQMINREPQNKKWQELLNAYMQAKLETIDIDQQTPWTLESLILTMISSYPTLLSTSCASLFLNFKDQLDRTILSYALENQSTTESTIEALIRAGANIFLQDKNGKTPVDYDINDLGLSTICKMLRKHPGVEKWQDLLNEYMDVRIKTIDMSQINPLTRKPLIFTMIDAYPELLSTRCGSRYVDLPHKSGRTFLSYALENKSTTESTVEKLILAGANFFTPDQDGKTPVDYDINGLGHSVIYQILRKDPANKKWQNLLSTYLEVKLKTIDMGQLNPQTGTPLFFTIIDSYRCLLSTKCASLNINFSDKSNRTLLSYVLKDQSTTESIVEALIRAGADLFIPDKDGKTPVDYDLNNLGLAAICKMLREEPSNKQRQDLLKTYMDMRMKILDINQLNPRTGEPLILTMIAAYPELLSTKYASLYVNFRQQPSGRSLLSYALENKSTTKSTVEALIRAGADLFTADESKKTPIDYDINNLSLSVICKMLNDEPQNEARRECLSVYVKKLLRVETIDIDQLNPKAGCASTYLNFKDQFGRTLLSYALENKSTTKSTVETLIRAGADLSIPDDCKKMPVNYDFNGLGFLVICKMFEDEPKKALPLFKAYMKTRLGVETTDMGQPDPKTEESLIFTMIDSYPELLSTTFKYLMPICPEEYEDNNGYNPLERFLIKKTIHRTDYENFLCLIKRYNYACKWQDISPPYRIYINDRVIQEAQQGKFDFLDEQKLDVNYQDPTTGFTLLYYAIEHSKLDIVKLLLQKGADPHFRGIADKTPYENASKNIRSLIDKYQEKLSIASTGHSFFSSSTSQNSDPTISAQLTS